MDDKLLQELIREIREIKKATQESVKVMTDIKNLFIKYDLDESFDTEQIRQG